MQFDSHHPMHVKRGVVKSLFDRAQAVTLEEEICVKKRNTKKEDIHPEVPGEATTTRRRGAVPQNHRGDPVCS